MLEVLQGEAKNARGVRLAVEVSCYHRLSVMAGKEANGRDLGRLRNRGGEKEKDTGSEGRKANACMVFSHSTAQHRDFSTAFGRGYKGGFGFWSFGLWSVVFFCYGLFLPAMDLMLDGTLQIFATRGICNCTLYYSFQKTHTRKNNKRLINWLGPRLVVQEDQDAKIHGWLGFTMLLLGLANAGRDWMNGWNAWRKRARGHRK